MSGTSLLVNEIYASIQGESTHAGRPCVFVRLTGCNLRCSYCDTEYAFYEGEKMSATAVIENVRSYGINLVEITGGEPLLQLGCAVLARGLSEEGMQVMVETSGERPIDVLPEGVIRIMDIKCPSSGESERMNWDNIPHLGATDEVKFVIGNEADYRWACTVIEDHALADRCVVLMAPVHGRIEPRTLADWMVADRLAARLQLPLHKYIWAEGTRGV